MREADNHLEKATLAAGCFWGVQAILAGVPGVRKTRVGYTGGWEDNPRYSRVSTGETGHAEAVEVLFDPRVISFGELLDYFWRLHDPTQKDRQGVDVGSQYRSAIFYHSLEQKQTALESRAAFNASGIFSRPVVTEIVPAGVFWPAEDYHQDYYAKTGQVCHILRPR